MEEKISKCYGDCSMCAMNCGVKKKGIIGVRTALIIFAGILILSALLFMPTEAHMPDAPPPTEFELNPIVVIDNGQETEIPIDDIANYHGQMCPGVASAFRQTQIGIRVLWGTETPQRDDIKIIAHFINGKAPQGKGNMKGRYDAFIYILNNTENLEIRSCKGGVDCFRTTIVRKSTGEEFNITLKEDVIPEGLFELKKKMMKKTITSDEMKELKEKWVNFRDDLLTKTDHELFEYEIQKKKQGKFSPAYLTLGIVIGIIFVLFVWIFGKKVKINA